MFFEIFDICETFAHWTIFVEQNKGIGDAGSTADFRMLFEMFEIFEFFYFFYFFFIFNVFLKILNFFETFEF